MLATKLGTKPGDFSPSDPEVLENPYPFYSVLREQAPVYLVPGAGCYLVSTFALVTKVARNHAVFSSDIRNSMGLPEEIDGLFIPTSALLLADQPLHTRHKSFVAKAFAPARMKKTEAEMQAIIDDLVDSFIDAGEVDFPEQFAGPLPLTIIADKLGVPRSYGEKFKIWSDAMVLPLSGASTPDDLRAIAPTLTEMNDFFTETFLARRDNPKDDIISDLATVEIAPVAGEPGNLPRQLTLEEGQTIIQLLMAGGNESSTSALCSLMEQFATNPGLADKLRDNPNLINAAIDETLRLESPAQGFWRLVKEDTELGGIAIPKGAMVFCCIGAANRDESQFDNPDQLDLARPNGASTLSFGGGIHFCAGVALSRMELLLSAQTILRRMKNFRLTPGKPLPRHNLNTTSRSLVVLNVSFDKLG